MLIESLLLFNKCSRELALNVLSLQEIFISFIGIKLITVLIFTIFTVIYQISDFFLNSRFILEFHEDQEEKVSGLIPVNVIFLCLILKY